MGNDKKGYSRPLDSDEIFKANQLKYPKEFAEIKQMSQDIILGLNLARHKETLQRKVKEIDEAILEYKQTHDDEPVGFNDLKNAFWQYLYEISLREDNN